MQAGVMGLGRERPEKGGCVVLRVVVMLPQVLQLVEAIVVALVVLVEWRVW